MVYTNLDLEQVYDLSNNYFTFYLMQGEIFGQEMVYTDDWVIR